MNRKLQRITVRMFFIFGILLVAVSVNSPSAVAKEVVVIPLIKNNVSAISPSDVLDLGTTSISAGSTADVVEITPKGANAGPITVPANKYLVITSLSVFPQSPGAGNIEMQLMQNTSARNYWKLTNAEPSHLSFGPGMLIDEGYSLTVKNYLSSSSSIRVSIYGYLTDK